MPKRNNYETVDELLAEAVHTLRDDSASLNSREADRNRFFYGIFQEGTKPRVIVKGFDENSYNGPSLRDFIDRLSILHLVAVERLKAKRLAGNITQVDYDKKIATLEQKREECIASLERDCQIQPIPLDGLKKRQKEIELAIRQATLYIQQYTFDALVLTDPNAFQSQHALDESLRAYMSDESRLTAKMGRPDFINVYANPEEGKTGEFISIQRTVDHTIPSTERDDTGPFEGKIPNFVECGVYYRDADGNQRSEFTGYRHSSYPPIREKDDFTRQKKAAKIVQSMLTELARQEMKKGHYGTIELNLSSLTLLTPYHRTDAIVPSGEQEYRQLAESYDAVMLYKDRPIKLNIDGREVTVKLNVSMLNAPGNPAGVSISERGTFTRWSMHSRLEKDINAQGMSEFIQKTCGYLTDYSGIQVVQDIKDIFKKGGEEFGLKHLLAKANERLAEAIKTGSGKSRYYKECKLEVDKLNKQIFKIERERMRACRKFMTNPNNRRDVDMFLASLQNPPRTTQSEVAELFFQTLLIYSDGKVDPIHYGSRFLLANQKMGNHVDFYCKSGEDRTGRMQNMVEELCIFYRNHGCYPKYDSFKKRMDPVDKIQQDQIALAVNEFSVSRDITGANSIGARGLQIADQLGPFKARANAMLPTVMGDRIGKTAKGVYSLTDSLIGKSPVRKIAPSLAIDKTRKKLLEKTLGNASRGNILFEEGTSRLGFSSRIVHSTERENYERSKSTPGTPTPPPRTTVSSPTYTAHRLSKDDLIVSEKEYSVGVLGRIEKSTHSVSDMTQVPEGGLPPDVNEDLAIEQAFAMVNPPFNPEASILVLSGADDEQVARIHAVLLFLKNNITFLKTLEIEVEGASAQPEVATKPSLQKKYDQAFVKAHLSDSALHKIKSHKTDFILLVEKQKHMKSVIKAGRPEAESELTLIEGASIILPKKP